MEHLLSAKHPLRHHTHCPRDPAPDARWRGGGRGGLALLPFTEEEAEPGHASGSPGARVRICTQGVGREAWTVPASERLRAGCTADLGGSCRALVGRQEGPRGYLSSHSPAHHHGQGLRPDVSSASRDFILGPFKTYSSPSSLLHL